MVASKATSDIIVFVVQALPSARGGGIPLDLLLKDRVVFVTGGSRGIGKSIVASLLAEGACVGTCARTIADLEAFRDSLPDDSRSKFLFYICDVRDPKLSVPQYSVPIRNSAGSTEL
jgi:NAD(P)-dependent dehydrogenase (short-subunit alcohol dehydrogenase family)